MYSKLNIIVIGSLVLKQQKERVVTEQQKKDIALHFGYSISEFINFYEGQTGVRIMKCHIDRTVDEEGDNAFLVDSSIEVHDLPKETTN